MPTSNCGPLIGLAAEGHGNPRVAEGPIIEENS